MEQSHSFRIRAERWKRIESKAWELSQKAGKLIKPTDIADTTLWLYIDKIELEDIENAKKIRKTKI